jgi:hypothetical protein
VFTLWGSSPNTTTNTTLTSPPPGLGAGEYLTRIRWEYGQVAVGMNASATPRITGQIVNPDLAGGPVCNRRHGPELRLDHGGFSPPGRLR